MSSRGIGDLAEEETLRLIFDASPAGMIVVDGAGKVVVANVEADRIFGYPRGELVGVGVEHLVPSSARERHKRLRDDFGAAASAKRSMGFPGALTAVRRDGSEFPAEIGLNPLPAASAGYVLAVVVDITERRKAEELVERQRRELERSNADLEQFAYVASHDLREPLRMVVSYAELLSERYGGRIDEKADKFVKYILEGAKRLQRMISDLLDYARVDTPTGAVTAVPTDAVVSDALVLLRTAIAESGAQIDVGTLPAVMADDGQLERVFLNLIENAIKFRGDRTPMIRIWADTHENGITFAVQDNGLGIDSSHAGKMFQMFQRFHDRTRYQGSGIGLAIARRIVERHGGRIWFDSVRGEGSTFRFTIPAARGGAP